MKSFNTVSPEDPAPRDIAPPKPYVAPQGTTAHEKRQVNEAFMRFWMTRDTRVLELAADSTYKPHEFGKAELKEMGLTFFELLWVSMKAGGQQGTWTRRNGEAGPHFTHGQTFLLVNHPELNPERSRPERLGIVKDLEAIKASPEFRHYVRRMRALENAVRGVTQYLGGFPTQEYFSEL